MQAERAKVCVRRSLLALTCFEASAVSGLFSLLPVNLPFTKNPALKQCFSNHSLATVASHGRSVKLKVFLFLHYDYISICG